MPTHPLRALALSAAVAVATFSACSSGGATPTPAAESPAGGSATSPPTTAVTWDESDEVAVSLDGKSTYTVTKPGTYRLSGSMRDGQVLVDSAGDGLVRLILAGVEIHSSRSAAIAITNAGEVDVVLAEGTTNVLSDAATYQFPDVATDEPNAALFSDATLTISGSGSLRVKGSFNDGIASKDGLVVESGTITVEAADDGLRGKDYVVVDGGSLTVIAGGDALKADNIDDPAKGYVTVNAGRLKLAAGGDGISATTNVVVADGTLDIAAGGGSTKTVPAGASAKGVKGTGSVTIGSGTLTIDAAEDGVHSDNKVVINGGTLRITSGDDGVHADTALQVNGGSIDITRSYEGLEAMAITLAGGDIRIASADDGINAAGAGGPNVTVSGGRMYVDSGGDALDVNGSGTMTGGTMILNGPTSRGNSAFDYDRTFTISGGLLVAAGSSGMLKAPTPTGTQGALLKTFATQAGGTALHVESASGEAVLTFVPTKAYQSIVVSGAGLTRGTTYTVSLGGTASGANTDGLYEASAYSGGTSVGTAAA